MSFLLLFFPFSSSLHHSVQCFFFLPWLLDSLLLTSTPISTITNPNTSFEAKHEAEKKLQNMPETKTATEQEFKDPANVVRGLKA